MIHLALWVASLLFLLWIAKPVFALIFLVGVKLFSRSGQ